MGCDLTPELVFYMASKMQPTSCFHLFQRYSLSLVASDQLILQTFRGFLRRDHLDSARAYPGAFYLCIPIKADLSTDRHLTDNHLALWS